MTEQQTAPPIPPRQRRRANKGRKRRKPTIETQPVNKPNGATDNPLEALNTAKQASSTGLDKSRIVRLLLAGMPKQKIAKKCNVTLTHCNSLIKEIDKDIETLGWNDYLSVLLSKLRLILDNHSQLSADIQELLLDCDMAIKGTQEAIDSETDKRIKLSLQSRLDRLRGDRLTLMRELNANNTALTGNLSKMGVTNVPTSSKNKVPTQPPDSGEIPNLKELPPSYRDMGREALLEAMGASNRDVGRYLRAETARKKQEDRDSE